MKISNDWLCSSCDQHIEKPRVPVDYDGPDFCPECRDVDTLTHVDDIDPTPWCLPCGSMTSKGCKCGPMATSDSDLSIEAHQKMKKKILTYNDMLGEMIDLMTRRNS